MPFLSKNRNYKLLKGTCAPKFKFMLEKDRNLPNIFSVKPGLTDGITFSKHSIITTSKKSIFIINAFIKGILSLCFSLVFLSTLSGCRQETKSNGPQYGSSPLSQANTIYHFGVHPLHNPIKLMESYQPLMEYLNKNIEGAKFVLEASRDYSNFEEKYKNGKLEFILPNPWQTLGAIKSGYTVIAMAGDPADFKGLFIVRKDSGIKEPADLKGKSVSYPSPTALAACIIPQYFLHTHGIDVNKDITNLYVGSQESSMMNVYLKTTAAGATWAPPWRDFQKTHPKEAAQLKSIWDIESLVNNSVMVRDDIPENIKIRVQKCLIELDKTQEGKKILQNLETNFFLLANNDDYGVVQTYSDRFEQEVRKIELEK